MANPRRSSYSLNINQSSAASENPLQFHGQNCSNNSVFSYQYFLHFLKKPRAFPFLLSVFLLLTWVSLRFQHSSHSSSVVSSRFRRPHKQWSQLDDFQVNLRRFTSVFPSRIAKDKRGWLLNPVSLALDSGLLGGAVSCVSVHVGEIRPGGIRGNHRHYSCNETFVIWGAKTKFRLENSQVDSGFAEVIIGADEVAVAVSPAGTAHALVNLDPMRSSFLLGCQDIIVNSNNSTDFNVWKDL